MARVPLLDLDPSDPANEKLLSYFQGRQMPAIYRALANAPGLLRAWTAFAWPLRSEPSVPRGLRELAIVRVAQLTGAEAEWVGHVAMALDHGMTQPQVDSLHEWANSDAFDDGERALLAFTDQLTIDGTVDDATFAPLAARWSNRELVEITLTVAFYACVSRVLNALAVEPPT
jgi:4-carboxymuconolactone decarboxylase